MKVTWPRVSHLFQP